MFGFHYWKCYMKEGPVFQTAKLFSVEVDYYNFGTCKLVDGAYFCGDHSCNTFKAFDTGKGSQTGVKEQIEPASYPDPYQPAAEVSRHVQKTAHNNPLYMDDYEAQYKSYSDFAVNYFEVIAHERRVQQLELHKRKTVSAGECKSTCSNDIHCRAYTVEGIRVCTLYIAGKWFMDIATMAGHTSVVPLLSSSTGATTYIKYTQNKPKTWLHAPVRALTRPSTASGPKLFRRLQELY
jgi:hypothetical protein